jgi:Protein of unknown function (DUF3617)
VDVTLVKSDYQKQLCFTNKNNTQTLDKCNFVLSVLHPDMKEERFMRSMIKICCASALAISLAACGGGDKGKDGKVGSAEASSGPVKREPGLWKSEMKLVKFEMDGMTSQMKEVMQKQMEKGIQIPATCVTKEQIEKQDMAQELSKVGGRGAECTFGKKEVGSVIDVEGVCKDGMGKESKVSMTGTVEPKKTDVLMKTAGASPMGQGQATIEMQITATHQGPCA